ncbi:MAG: sulfurtransferase TusA family protein [Nitrospiraceae bacterium]|nr:MAG: sulfurtransferase TusA family protein [Nitrospiraceae bacterium]
MGNDMKVDKTLDIKGLSAQRLKEVTQEILNMMAKGQILRVIADNAETDMAISMVCEHLGCRLLSMEQDGGVVCLTIMK